jgi:hypothetical protein
MLSTTNKMIVIVIASAIYIHIDFIFFFANKRRLPVWIAKKKKK